MLKQYRSAAICSLLLLSAGCGDRPPAAGLHKQARVVVQPSILDSYAGTYRLPSGALVPVFREGDRLMSGVPPRELLAQTSRKFVSNLGMAVLTFDRDPSGRVERLNYELAGRDLWIERIDAAAARDPTAMVDAGGHQLRMLSTGSGGPAVIIEDGFGSSIETSAELQSMLANFTQVVAYDHAGSGGSEPGPQPRHARRVAAELRTALGNLAVQPPYVLVGSSIGGDYIRVFAGMFPKDVAGIVLLDPTPDWDQLNDWLLANSPQLADSVAALRVRADAAASEMMKLQEAGRSQEWSLIDTTRAQAAESQVSAEIAATMIIGAAGRQTHALGRDKVKFFRSWLNEQVPHAKLVLANKSGHAIFPVEPELVVNEIRLLVNAARQ